MAGAGGEVGFSAQAPYASRNRSYARIPRLDTRQLTEMVYHGLPGSSIPQRLMLPRQDCPQTLLIALEAQTESLRYGYVSYQQAIWGSDDL